MGHTTIDQSLLRQCVTVGFVSWEDQILFHFILQKESQYPLLGTFKMPLIVSILLAGIHKQQNLNCGHQAVSCATTKQPNYRP